MVYYYDSKGKKYLGKIQICSKCKKEKIVRINRINTLCRECSYGNRKTDVKDNELFINEKRKNRTFRLRAVKAKCSICQREYLRRKNCKFKTSICNLCICNFNGTNSRTTGIGDYVYRALEHYGKSCSTCQSIENIEVHHIDFDRTNNRIENLQVLCKSCHKKIHWDKFKLDPVWMESFIKNRSGQKGPSKLTNEKIKEIRNLYPLFSHKELAKMFNVAKTTIGHIVNYRTWKDID